jgi:DNA-directed RNA polymerase specialized sigma24 family protein
MRFLLWLADLERALHAMPPKEYHAVLLYGLIRLPLLDVAEKLGVSHPTVLKRYDAGIEWLTDYLNGETE